jgi:hypothetical protein
MSTVSNTRPSRWARASAALRRYPACKDFVELALKRGARASHEVILFSIRLRLCSRPADRREDDRAVKMFREAFKT